ncbi:MAG: MATE family efflux transporter, partial [Lentisphaeria bacterium]|nr:MATE family efflux transporter [Lentisphaeria bacterium]
MGKEKQEAMVMELPRTRMFSNRDLLNIMVPLVLSQTLASLVGLVDGIMVSAAGEAAVSGVSLVNMISGIILVLFGALTTGGAVLTSQYLGARQKENARQSAGQMTLMAFVISMVLMTVCLFLTEPILRLFFGAVEDDVMAACIVYFRYDALSYPFIALFSAGAAIFRCVGNSKISLRINVIKNLINVVGNAICVYGLKMGVEGVAIPTLISRIIGAALIMVPACDSKQELSIDLKNLLRIYGGMMKKIVHIGIPTAFENSLFQLGRTLVTSMVTAFGTAHIAANATANSITAIVVIISTGMSLGMITVVGQCLGAHDTEQAKYYTKKLLLWCYVSQGLLQALLLIFQDQAIGLYSNLSLETIALTKKLITVHLVCAIPMYPISFLLPNALRAANDGRYTLTVSMLSMFLCRIVMSWVLCTQMQWGALGIWVAMVLDWV